MAITAPLSKRFGTTGAYEPKPFMSIKIAMAAVQLELEEWSHTVQAMNKGSTGPSLAQLTNDDG